MLWGAILLVVIYVEPELLKDVLIPESYLPFYLLLIIALWYTIAIFVRRVFASLILTITMVAGLVFSMLGLMHIGLALVILLTLVIESVYIYRSYEKNNASHEQ